MAEACRERRGDLAAYALGRLDEAEAVALRAHLDGCGDCRAELRELEAIAAVLPNADVARVADDALQTPTSLEQKVLTHVARARGRTHDRRRLWLVTAAAVLVGLAMPLVAVAVDDDKDDGVDVVLASPVQEAQGDAELHALPTGTEVQLRTTGLDTGEWYWVWLTDAEGNRVAAGTLRGAHGGASATMTVALDLADAERLWVTDADDRVVLDARF
jgi:anti-sigma factor RsiW